MRYPLTLIAVATLCACGTNRPVTFGAESRAAGVSEPSAPTVELFYDRDGDLYPSPFVEVDLSPDTLHQQGWPSLRRDGLQSKLECHFALEFGASPSPCLSVEAPSSPGPWTDVRRQLSVPSSVGVPEAWQAIQDSLANRAVEALHTATRRADGSARTLVVLVHGFNNDASAAQATFGAIQEAVESWLPGDSKAFLHLYWDGLENSLGIPIWKNAQFNFPLVGVSFRRVLNGIEADIPVRILTHSSGGPLVASTLWDASASIAPRTDASGRLVLQRDARTWPRYRVYEAARDTTEGPFRIPDRDGLRVGMVVPAMPGATFGRYRAGEGGPERIILGVNPNDAAIVKLGVPTSGFLWRATCRQSGSACLSALPSEYCTQVRRKVQPDADTAVRLIDFGEPRSQPWFVVYDDHAMSAYLRRPDMARFLGMLFGEDLNDPGEAASWCR